MLVYISLDVLDAFLPISDDHLELEDDDLDVISPLSFKVVMKKLMIVPMVGMLKREPMMRRYSALMGSLRL